MTLTEIDSFFQNHPLKERYFAVLDNERAGTAAVAERDVMAAVSHCEITGTEDREFLNAAIAEQTIFLILNPEYLTGAYTHTQSLSSGGENRRFNTSNSPLGQRAAALISPLLIKAAKDDSGSESDDPGSEVAPDDEEPELLPPVIRIIRG